MLYWVIYDISENKIRSKVASKCKDYGLYRVQKSSFLGEITKNKAEMLMEEVKDIVGEEFEDCVFLIPHCKECFNNKIIIGYFDEELVKNKEFVYLMSNVK